MATGFQSLLVGVALLTFAGRCLLGGNTSQLIVGMATVLIVTAWARRDWLSKDRLLEILGVIGASSFVFFLGAMGASPDEPPITSARALTATAGILGTHALFGVLRFGFVLDGFTEEDFRPRLARYFGVGALTGGGLAMIALIPVVILTALGEWSLGSAGALLVGYVVVGGGIGLLLGIGWPLSRYPLGLMATGMLGCFVGYGAIGVFMAMSGTEDMSLSDVPMMGATIAVAMGAAWGYLLPGRVNE
jgi:hypothetical protein